ncbi:glycosyltransferase family 4 protein [Haloarcula litorea]|uniref:glycosyltransferase family 4 protein n=1 Tax=Haloarcula litorea TaxID=3032579 RepID=UPI0023E7E26F|nr:glycosyltransferase family 4 protein [Halomicroarcula sp. GDY20]
MHVLLVAREFPPDVVGGVAYHAYNLARALIETGHRVTVLSSTAGDYADETHATLPEVDVVRLDCRKHVSPRAWFDRAVRSALAAKPPWLDDIDVVHSHEYIQFGRLSLVQPVVQKIHFNLGRKFDFFPFRRYPAPVRPFVRAGLSHGVRPLERRVERNALASADGLVFVSDLTKRIQEQDTGFSGPTTVVHNGVDTEQFSPGPESYGSYFLFVGGDQARKGYETVVDAFAATERPLRIAGTTRPAGDKTPSNVEFLGYVEQSRLPELYRGARALVHPAQYEPFGNIVLESLACATPVVVTGPDHCGSAEVLTDEVARIVPPGDPVVLGDAIESFDASAYSPRACRQLAEQYTWESVADQTLQFARSLIE